MTGCFNIGAWTGYRENIRWTDIRMKTIHHRNCKYLLEFVPNEWKNYPGLLHA